MFKLHAPYKPTGDQPQAIKQLTDGLNSGTREQTLLGVTGSGKTFTMANIIQNVQKPTLILAHNKTLAAQLYSEFREFFPENEVHYFVSYFDYYQPEAYIASTDTYIEKDSAINDEIDRLRHAATEALLTRRDVIVIASVSCIYGIGAPEYYLKMSLPLWKNAAGWVNEDKKHVSQADFIRQLVKIQYHRNDLAFERGNFRVMGDTIDLFPANGEYAYRFEFGFDTLETVKIVDPLTFDIREKPDHIHIFPNTHYATPEDQLEKALVAIEKEFNERLSYFEKHEKYLEAQRLSQRTKYDLEMLRETGFVKGIENYSRHLEGRKAGEPPATLLDFFPKDFLLIVDESHMTLPQVRGMYNGDHARKETLVEYGFRLPSALDNRPLTYAEFNKKVNQAIYVSATPGEYELEHSPAPAEQVIRPTGLLDPEIEIRSSIGQIDDIILEVEDRIKKKQRTLITTLTKRMAEDLTDHLKEHGIKTAYIHSDIDTLERGDILRDLRSGVYDVLVGINLLREGLDLPEVSLVAILDADKEGFLRSDSALIQTIGRAARHVEGKVIMYADNITKSMEVAITETNRRREIQHEYNEKNHITPHSVEKEISAGLRAIIPEKLKEDKLDIRKIPKDELPSLVKDLTTKMKLAAANLEFEKAAALRDEITRINEFIEFGGHRKKTML
ncbi:excinuclease ABC subunit UvrB [Candidatus Saccharibacteria bacterium]|nr:excinuclease ABC subunit UvrB [Candidatus Saccharibacteria bacterium]